jgi:hypothetical protein
MHGGLPGGYDRLLQPLAQIEAAEAFYLSVEAFVADTWGDLYRDRPPNEDALDQVTPATMLDTLAMMGLRFELAGYMKSEEDIGDGYWEAPYGGSWVDILVYSWMHKVMDATGLDARAFVHGLSGTDLIFVPDEVGVASAAYVLTLGGEADGVQAREDAEEARALRLMRKDAGFLDRRGRGEGPRTPAKTMADKIALALKASAATPLSPEEIAKRIRHDNVPSVTAALHQITAYRKPKRLAGWVLRVGDGLYAWADRLEAARKGARKR